MKKQKAFTWLELVVSLVVVFIVSAILYPVFTQNRIICYSKPTLSNVKQLVFANLMYMADYDDHLPDVSKWMDVLGPYPKNEKIFIDPLLKDRQDDEYGFAFFEPLSGVDTKTVLEHETVPLIFQSALLSRNAASDLMTLPNPPRNKNVHNLGFLDGHAKAFTPDEIDLSFKIEFKPVAPGFELD